MPKFINKGQMRRASDEELEKFFAETTFEGVFSREIKSKKTDFYKGSITDIKLEGRTSNLAPLFLNVPHSSNNIPEGPCSFKCRLNIPAFREEPPRYILNLLGSSLRSINSVSAPSIDIGSKDTKEQELFDMWGVENCQCIGFYHYDEENDVYIVDDLRKPNFDHIPYYPGDAEKKPIRILYPSRIYGIKPNDYYIFTWKLSHRNAFNPYEIVLDFETERPKPIDPKWFIDTLFNDRHNDKSKNFGSATNFLDTLSKQLSAKESTFVYELLQNANDYPVEGKSVDVEFYITDNYLLFLHSGVKFNVRNISGICGINEKEKTANKKTIGYKGIGFKTVFLNNHYVYLRTGKYSFRFDEGEMPEKKMGGKIRRLGAPFQILPIWTSHNEVAKEVNDILDYADKKFQVQIALRPDDNKLLHVGRNSYETLFKEIFSDSNIILFIPNINSVRVIINGHEERACYRKTDEWVVNDYEQDIVPEFQDLVNKTIEKGNSRIPEKYKDFECTRVSFACRHEDNVIKPVEKAILYCYLPTAASWGLPFLMNTDMIPKGDRNDIEHEVRLLDEEDTNFNEVLSAIAGAKLFDWLLELMKSRKWDLGSVFSLVPNFEKCKDNHSIYETYIERFEEAFNDRVETEQIVPVIKGLANTKFVIYDTTGLTTSGIMTDEEFLKFIEKEDYYLPLLSIRKDRYLKTFLNRYVGDDQKFEKDNIFDLIANEDFREWLKVQENNDKFLKFLLEKDWLEDFLDEEIFLEAGGVLLAAADLYYDVDEFLDDLQAFTDHICYLSPATRDFFKRSKKWMEVTEDAFAVFDCDSFVNDELLSVYNIKETKLKLQDKETSIHFFKFLAENVTFDDSYLSLPFISVDDEIIDDFEERFVFFNSSVGRNMFESEWLSSIEVSFVSDDYTEKTKKYLKENFGVVNFSHDYLINQIVLNKDYQENISDGINDEYTISKDFVDYCYKHKKFFESGSLRNYALSVYDGDGDDCFCLSEDVIYFPSTKYDEYAAKEWISYNWMYVLNEAYFDGISDKNDFVDFLDKTFWICKLTEKNLYQKVVKPNLSKIFQFTSGNSDSDGTKNIDFVSYLDQNYKLIFEEEHDAAAYKSFIVCSNEVDDLKIGNNVYLYDEELADLLSQTWFPDSAAHICHKDYGNSKALETIGCKVYKFGDFYDAIIIPKLSSINRLVKTKELSIAFHSYIIDRKGALTADQLAKMQDAKVYLYGHTSAVATSTGHKTLSAKARELFDQKLVSISDLDIIDPDYKTSENAEYWEARLGNSKFNVNDFFVWLKDHIETFNKTIGTFDQSKVFYRWLKDNANEQQLENVRQLSLGKFVMSSEGERKSDTIYFPDAYMTEKGIEDIVRLFDPNAWFISPDYIEENDDVASWQNFWSKLGIKSEIIDILHGTVIPHLSTIDNENLPKLLADNRPALEEMYDNDLVSHLTGLRVKGYSGGFYTLDETIYIDCDLDEPFKYIELPNVVAFDSKEEKKLIKDIIEEVDGIRITSLSDWQQKKVDYYLDLQDDNTDNIRSYHYRFIEELAVIRQTNKERLKAIERIEEIKLLGKDNIFTLAKELTLGSVYRPNYDFELCDVSTSYVSDNYDKECEEKVGRLFKDMGIHYDFEEEDVPLLKSRKCALYFWTQYIVKTNISIVNIKEIINKHLLDNIECIPTKDYMKRPNQLYFGSEVKNYVKSIDDWENKVPLQDIPEVKLTDDTTLFSLLPFGVKLRFEDALFALYKIAGQERRTQLLLWMIGDYDENVHAPIIEQYREDEEAKWYNNSNELHQIKELYALDYSDKNLKQYLGSNRKIINDAYFPAGESFRVACDILHIPTITSEDLIIEFSDDVVVTTQHIDFKVYALVIAGIIDSNKWKVLYDEYCDKIDALVLHKCSNINITCKQDKEISKSLKKFYHEKNSVDFYYIDNRAGWHDGRIYKDFYKEFAAYIGAYNITDDHLNDLMFSREDALQFVVDNNTLKLDEEYKAELEKLISGATENMTGNVAATDNEEDAGTYRPKISITRNETSINGDGEESDTEYFFDNEDIVNSAADNEDETETEELEEVDDSDEEDVDESQVEEESEEESCEDEDLSDEEEYSLDDELEADQQDDFINHGDFVHTTIQRYRDGEHEEVVCEHYRNGTWVRGHYRNGIWISGHWRSGSFVSEHNRTAPEREFGYTSSMQNSSPSSNSASPENNTGTIQEEAKQPFTSNESAAKDRLQTPTKEESSIPSSRSYDPDRGLPVGSIESDDDYQPLGSRPYSPRHRRNVKPYSREDLDRLRSNPSPLQLDSLPPTTEEIDILSKYGITVEQIADTNYLVNLRLYQNLQKEYGEEPEEDLEQFIRNADDVTTHKMKSGKYIHACSAARGVMYIGPSVWEKMVDDKWAICVYLNGQGKKFAYINSAEEFLDLVAKDDVVIKITGKEKVNVVNKLYNGILHGVKGSAYTLIRVAAQTNMDAVFAHYVGAMAEAEDGNDTNEY